MVEAESADEQDLDVSTVAERFCCCLVRCYYLISHFHAIWTVTEPLNLVSHHILVGAVDSTKKKHRQIPNFIGRLNIGMRNDLTYHSTVQFGHLERKEIWTLANKWDKRRVNVKLEAIKCTVLSKLTTLG